MRQHGVRAVQVPQQVGLQHPAVGLHRHLVEAAYRAHAHAVHPDVDAAEMPQRLLRKHAHRGGIGHVGGHADGMAAGLAAGQRHGGQRIGIARCQHQAGPAPREGQRDGMADTAGGTGDDHHRMLGHVGGVGRPGLRVRVGRLGIGGRGIFAQGAIGIVGKGHGDILQKRCPALVAGLLPWL